MSEAKSKATWSGKFPIFAGIDDLIASRDDLVIYIEDHIDAGDGVQEILEKARDWKFWEARLVDEEDETDWYFPADVEIDLLVEIEDIVTESVNEYEPDHASPPGETILECMNGLGITTTYLSTVTGYAKTVWLAVFKGEREIDRDMAEELSNTLGADAEFWLTRERNYRQCLRKQQVKQDGGDHRGD